MRSRYQFTEPNGVYFLTSTVVEWIPVFTRPATCTILLNALTHCRRNKGLRIYGYVVMENYLHLLAAGPDLPGTMQAFRGYTARVVIDTLEATGPEWMLRQFAYYKKHHKVNSKYQFWQEGTHPQLVQNTAMLEQKLAYIHDNPVRRGWVELPEHWRYSSARSVLRNEVGVLEIDPLPD